MVNSTGVILRIRFHCTHPKEVPNSCTYGRPLKLGNLRFNRYVKHSCTFCLKAIWGLKLHANMQ